MFQWDYFSGKLSPDELKVENWYKALNYLESRLKKHDYLVADKVKIK